MDGANRERLEAFDDVFAARLSTSKADVVDGTEIVQLGARTIPFGDAPAWPAIEGLEDEAIIETFLVERDGLMALSDSPLLDAWRPRAEAMANRVLDACVANGLEPSLPAYLTCSITPVALLEGNPHLDDDQFQSDAPLGIVAINGEHVGPRVRDGQYDGHLAVHADVAPGPLALDEEELEAFRADGSSAGPSDPTRDIVIFGQFGQLHAGPATNDMPTGATHRQLMVLRTAAG